MTWISSHGGIDAMTDFPRTAKAIADLEQLIVAGEALPPDRRDVAGLDRLKAVVRFLKKRWTPALSAHGARN
jgi:hypothetical protein